MRRASDSWRGSIRGIIIIEPLRDSGATDYLQCIKVIFSAFHTMNTTAIIHEILEDYGLPIRGYHGVVHWARVLENGQRLAERTGAKLEVVTLFALFHDSRRMNEHSDFGHGHRGDSICPVIAGSARAPRRRRF